MMQERIRGENLAVLYSEGLSLEDAIQTAKKRNLVIASHDRIERAFHDNESIGFFRGFNQNWNLEHSLRALRWGRKNVSNQEAEWDYNIDGWNRINSFWTGTMIAYVNVRNVKKRGKYGKTIEHEDGNDGNVWVFPVPEEYQGERIRLFQPARFYNSNGVAFFYVKHPDFELETDGKYRVIHADEDKIGMGPFPRYRCLNGYSSDHDKIVDINRFIDWEGLINHGKDYVRFVSSSNKNYVGAVCRPYHFGSYYRDEANRKIRCNENNSDNNKGIIVEVPSLDDEQICFSKSLELSPRDKRKLLLLDGWW